jgi:hypothetical protein
MAIAHALQAITTVRSEKESIKSMANTQEREREREREKRSHNN